MIKSNHSEHVWYIPPGTLIENKTWVGGWYFVDEAEQFDPTPHATEREALDALNEYAAQLNAWAAKQ
jgi:hypothetical protein